MSRWKILVTAQAFAVSGQAAHKLLVDGGHEVVVASKFGPLTLESLIHEAHDCDAIIAATDPYDHMTFAALPRLKLVARCGVGVDSVNMQQARIESLEQLSMSIAKSHYPRTTRYAARLGCY